MTTTAGTARQTRDAARRTVAAIVAALLATAFFEVVAASPASAATGDVFAAGTTYCADSYTGHKSGRPDEWVVDINFPGDLGTPILAPADGTVRASVDDTGLGGYTATWTSADGSESLTMAHLRDQATAGDVKGGEGFAVLGNSGSATSGAHLHIYRDVDGKPAPVVLSGVEIVPEMNRPDDGTYGNCSGVTNYVSRGPIAKPPAPVATALIIDSSGSMGSNDPQDRRLDGANAYVTASLPNDEVGVVDFDSSTRVASEAVEVGPNRQALSAAIASINSAGGTNLGAGLDAGFGVLERSTGTARAAIFLTDGSGSYSNQAARYADRGWKVFAIGLGSGVNGSLLQQMATQTDGRYIPLTASTSLVCVFQQIRQEIAGLPTSSCEPAGIILQGATNNLQVTVPSSYFQGDPDTPPLQGAGAVGQVTLTVVWDGSDIDMTLVAPSGRRIDGTTADSDVVITTGSTFETFTVFDPEVGDWGVELFGADIPDGGEPYYFSRVMLPKVSTDTTGPVITWVDEIADGAEYDFGLVPPSPTCTAVDDESGVTGDGCVVESYSTDVGTHNLTATASDEAGNVTTETRAYEVLPWTLTGFYNPVREGWNEIKSGSAVPLKFEVFQGQTELRDTAVVTSIDVQPIACDTTDPLGDAAPLDGVRYDMEEGQYIQKWKSSRVAGCYEATLRTDDGSSLSAVFNAR